MYTVVTARFIGYRNGELCGRDRQLRIQCGCCSESYRHTVALGFKSNVAHGNCRTYVKLLEESTRAVTKRPRCGTGLKARNVGSSPCRYARIATTPDTAHPAHNAAIVGIVRDEARPGVNRSMPLGERY